MEVHNGLGHSQLVCCCLLQGLSVVVYSLLVVLVQLLLDQHQHNLVQLSQLLELILEVLTLRT